VGFFGGRIADVNWQFDRWTVIDQDQRIYTTSFLPDAYSDHVFINGLLQMRGAEFQYVLNGMLIIFNDWIRLRIGDKIFVVYSFL